MASGQGEDPRGRAVYEHLVQVHELYRRAVRRLRDQLAEMSAGPGPAGSRDVALAFSPDRLRGDIRVHCLRFCAALTAHHTIEDTQMFPQLRHYSPAAGAVVDRLVSEHERIAGLVTALERKVGELAADPASLGGVAEAVTGLAGELEAHLDSEERSLAGLFRLRTA